MRVAEGSGATVCRGIEIGPQRVKLTACVRVDTARKPHIGTAVERDDRARGAKELRGDASNHNVHLRQNGLTEYSIPADLYFPGP